MESYNCEHKNVSGGVQRSTIMGAVAALRSSSTSYAVYAVQYEEVIRPSNRGSPLS